MNRSSCVRWPRALPPLTIGDILYPLDNAFLLPYRVLPALLPVVWRGSLCEVVSLVLGTRIFLSRPAYIRYSSLGNTPFPSNPDFSLQIPRTFPALTNLRKVCIFAEVNMVVRSQGLVTSSTRSSCPQKEVFPSPDLFHFPSSTSGGFFLFLSG